MIQRLLLQLIVGIQRGLLPVMDNAFPICNQREYSSNYGKGDGNQVDGCYISHTAPHSYVAINSFL